MPNVVVTEPPAEVAVSDFCTARKLEAWQVRALCARFNLRPDSTRPVVELERMTDTALHGGI